jgi:hypothetical protein
MGILRREPEVTEWVNLLKQRYNGMKMIVGRDKLDEVQVRRNFQDFIVRGFFTHADYKGGEAEDRSV